MDALASTYVSHGLNLLGCLDMQLVVKSLAWHILCGERVFFLALLVSPVEPQAELSG